MTTAIVHIFSAPAVGAAGTASASGGPSVFVDLEPTGRAVCCPSIRYFRQVDMDWAEMVTADSLIRTRSVTRLLVHFNRNGIACLYTAPTGNTLGTVDIASDIGGSDIR